MAIIAILKGGKSKKPVREEIDGSDFDNLHRECTYLRKSRG
jgi:hypothetical protein